MIPPCCPRAELLVTTGLIRKNSQHDDAGSRTHKQSSACPHMLQRECGDATDVEITLEHAIVTYHHMKLIENLHASSALD